MVRFSYFLVLLTVAGGCLNLKLKQPISVDSSDWLMEGASITRGHEAHTRVDPPLIEMWKYDSAAGIGPGGGLIADSILFFGTRKGLVHAINLNDGRRVGRKNFGAPIEGGMALSDSMLFVPLGLDKKSIVALNYINGAKKWNYEGESIEAGLIYENSMVFAADVQARVYALRSHNGDLVWEYSLGEASAVVASPLIAGQALVVIREEGEAFALDKQNGAVLWRKDVGAPVYNSPATDHSRIYIPTTRGVVATLDAETGDVLWNYTVPDSSMRFTTPALVSDSGWLIVGGTDNMVRALNAQTGELVWEADVEAATNVAPLATQNTIYVGTLRSKLFALDKTTGSVIWTHDLTGRIKSAMPAYAGRLIVFAETQQVLAFAPDTTTIAELN